MLTLSFFSVFHNVFLCAFVLDTCYPAAFHPQQRMNASLVYTNPSVTILDQVFLITLFH